MKMLSLSGGWSLVVVALAALLATPADGRIIKSLDKDGDGIPNYRDPDVDGDGLFNFEDPDIDGDTLNNDAATEADIDGDGATDDALDERDIDGDTLKDNQKREFDIDGDFKLDEAADEADIDGDGAVDEASDADMDGDGVLNTKDKDMDGDASSTARPPSSTPMVMANLRPPISMTTTMASSTSTIATTTPTALGIIAMTPGIRMSPTATPRRPPRRLPRPRHHCRVQWSNGTNVVCGGRGNQPGSRPRVRPGWPAGSGSFAVRWPRWSWSRRPVPPLTANTATVDPPLAKPASAASATLADPDVELQRALEILNPADRAEALRPAGTSPGHFRSGSGPGDGRADRKFR